MTTTAIFVLGMHRSGTSALSATLGMLGANLGTHLIPARSDNKKGFFEDSRCVNLNINILRNFGTDGHNGISLPGNWKDLREVRQLAGRIRTVLADLGTAPVYALKDPRLSLLAEIWIDCAHDLGHEVKLVVAARHPLQVAQSMEARDKDTRYGAYMMWLLHTVQAVKIARLHAHAYISFEDLQDATDSCLERVIKLVNKPDAFFINDKRRKKIEEFLDPSLINNREVADRRFPRLTNELNALYDAVRTGDEALFDERMQRGLLRMFNEMTASYRAHLSSIQVRARVKGAPFPQDANVSRVTSEVNHEESHDKSAESAGMRAGVEA